MFKEMRRQDRELAPEETAEILTNGVYGVLSLNGQNSGNHAYGVPVNYVYNGNCLYIHCAMEGEKLARIHNNNKVSFCVVGKANILPEKFSTQYSSVIAYGQAHAAGEEERVNALLAFIDKYSADFKEKGIEYVAKAQQKTQVVRIDIEHVTGKSRKA
ncbi:pyridoxamine 5'-phosphate oxidase [Lucifera butyrica]|uniref:Pyridoxamine 5'-phosphate oxidase n=1 Tax=Lucifera butyrica TaxID=1351585 RepID=A0A498RDF2_9FIRM|nr:pyridoxamine 5'-phosphate oxidase family protein [Lucifera butyrica]VBB09491.1 pyridoxamine 5'-phosphate oxidase [Lucifera butyrica]